MPPRRRGRADWCNRPPWRAHDLAEAIEFSADHRDQLAQPAKAAERTVHLEEMQDARQRAADGGLGEIDEFA